MSSGTRRRHGATLATALAFAFFVIAGAATAASAANPTFAPAANYPTGSTVGPGPAPINTVAADFNGDGRPDVATANNFALSLGPIVLLNTGGGAFGPPHVANGAPAVQSLAAGDVNNDGKQDLVAMSASTVFIMIGDGHGNFTVPRSYTLILGAQVEAILCDINRDGKLDIVSQTFNAIQTLLGNGDGTFVTGPRTTIPGATTLSAITAAKLDGDNIPDLFAVDGLSGSAIALKGVGNGSFTVKSVLWLSGLIPEDVDAGDLNGDGIDDIAVIGSFSFTVATALSDGNEGFSTGLVPMAQSAGLGPTSLAFADFNHDGRQDFVVSDVANLVSPSVVMFTGNGTVRPTNTGTFAVTTAPQTPAVADYNGDGRSDIGVVGLNALSVLINTTP